MNDNDLAPKSSEKSIQEHLRNYYSQLKSGQDIAVSSLFSAYQASRPSLHKLLDSPSLDLSALNYSFTRLPRSVLVAKNIVLGLSREELLAAGIDVTTWVVDSSPSRRRLCYYDHISHTLAVIINSDSDIDDFLNCLIAFQLERQKFSKISDHSLSLLVNTENFSEIGLQEGDWFKLKNLFGSQWQETLNSFHRNQDLLIKCLPQDEKFTQNVVTDWWHKLEVASLIFGFETIPIYFVSSNLHSLTNLIGGYVQSQQDFIITHIEKKYPQLYTQWLELKQTTNAIRVIDFLYYASDKYFSDNPAHLSKKVSYEESLGIRRLKISSELPCEAQLIPVSAIAKSLYRDPNLHTQNPVHLAESKAYILNIDYPLGLSAYYILSHILQSHQNLKGVYIIGKAAILSGEIGDVQVPKVVFDERTNNIIFPSNIFNEFFPFPAFQSSILQNQKAISVYGTFLENETQLNNYTSSGFNIIEMESGPYLTAILKHQQDWNAIPHDQVSHLDKLPFDLGIINYASDNPLSHTLGDGVMSLKGVEPTYLASLTTLQRIVDLESA